MMAWAESVRYISNLAPGLQVLMMTMQGMVGKLGSWFLISSFLFFAYSLAQYVIFGSERGMLSFTQYFLHAFTLAVGHSEIVKTADNIQDAIFEDSYNVLFILLFTIILINLLIAIMTDAFTAVQASAAARYCYSQFEQLQFYNMSARGFTEESNGRLFKNFLHIKSLFRSDRLDGWQKPTGTENKTNAATGWGGLTSLIALKVKRHAANVKEKAKPKEMSVELQESHQGNGTTGQSLQTTDTNNVNRGRKDTPSKVQDSSVPQNKFSM